MSPITTHILDTAAGTPARNVPVALSRRDGERWTTLAKRHTNDDGRVADLMEAGSLTPGVYRMYFDTSAYYQAQGKETFYPEVEVVFRITNTDEHYHVPLLLSPFGYSTYRGS